MSVAVTSRAGGAVAPLVLALGVDDEPPGGLVLLDERAGAGVHHRDRPELDLAGALEVVAVDLRDGGPGEAAGDGLDVLEGPPGLGQGRRHGERVVQVHAGLTPRPPRARRGG